MRRYLLSLVMLLGLAACEDDTASSGDDGETATTATDDDTDDDGTATAGTADSSDDGSGEEDGTAVGEGADCEGSEDDIDVVVCAAQALYDTLTTDEQAAILYDFDDATAKTTWSNLPNVDRNGLKFGDLSDESLSAVMALAKVVLSEAGYEDFVGVLAADDYLAAQGGGMGGPPGGGGGLTYGSDNYYVAFIGAPSVSGDWMLQLGGHHMAYNITYVAGVGFPTPHHLGVEPKGEFTIDSETYAPMGPEGQAFAAVFTALDETQLSKAFLADESYADVLLGPEDGSGVAASDYPSGDNRGGLLVSDLSADQQALVVEAIAQWVGDYHADISTALMEDYTSDDSFGDTYVAWAGTESAGPDVDVGGTYFRIDGPALWLEVACQNGVIISGQTHYHSIFRDKSGDYAGSL